MIRTPKGVGRLARAVTLLTLLVLLGAALAGCGSATGSSATRGVQHFDVDMSTGVYVPAELNATAGTPVQITFGQGKGCVGTLVFPAFDIKADMTQGPKTLDLGVLQPGDYPWACGMNMQHGVLHVK